MKETGETMEKFEKNRNQFLLLLKSAIWGAESIDEEFKDTDWESVYSISRFCKLTAVVSNTVNRVNSKFPVNSEVLGNFKKTAYLTAVNEYQKNILIKKIIESANNQNIKIAIFKGPVVADAYPEYSLRYSSDTDIFVFEEKRDEMLEVLLGLGYLWNQKDSKANVQNLYYKNFHSVELHTVLWEDYTGSRINTLNSYNLTSEDKWVKGVFCGIEFETIDYGNQLIYLLFHFIKHLVIESAHLRYVLDILLFMVKHAADIDMVYVKDKLVELDYWNFYCIICQIGVKYLGFSKEQLYYDAVEDEKTDTLVNLLLTTPYTQKEDIEYKWHMTYYLQPYLTGDYDADMTESKKKRRLNYLFPSQAKMPDEYSYARRSKLLVPVAWIHRIFDYIWTKWFRRKKRMAGRKRMENLDHKIDMLRSINLIK